MISVLIREGRRRGEKMMWKWRQRLGGTATRQEAKDHGQPPEARNEAWKRISFRASRRN